MSAILDFYRGIDTNTDNQTFFDVVAMSDEDWERGHSFIQWMFPLPETSKKVRNCPVATQDDYNAIADDPVLKMRVQAALGRYLLFLFRTSQWRKPQDHNHLRITRVLRCLCFCGLNDAAYDFNQYVQYVADVDKQTKWYWDEALKRHPAWLEG